MNNAPSLNDSVLSDLKCKDHTKLGEEVNELTCSHMELIELLARYQVLSEQDDEQFDNWYDSLSNEQHNLLKTFEVVRAHYEHQS